MSTLTGLISSGGGGSVIASIQRGYTAVSQYDPYTNVTISSVDLTKSFVSFGGNEVTSADRSRDAWARLTSATNIRVGGFDDGNRALNVAWEVIEYA